MCLRRDWFSSYLEVNGGKVLLGNNISCSVVGIGTVAINMFDGMTRTLKEVRHVLDLKRNLISLGTLDESGYIFKAENGKLTISKCVMVVMKGQKRNGLHILEGHTLKGLVGSVLRIETDKTILWHRRLDHLSDRGLKELHKQGLLCGDSINKIDFCQYCILGKQHRLAFKLQYTSQRMYWNMYIQIYGGLQESLLMGEISTFYP